MISRDVDFEKKMLLDENLSTFNGSWLPTNNLSYISGREYAMEVGAPWSFLFHVFPSAVVEWNA